MIRGADYKGLWISVGIDVATGLAVADVVERVKARLRELLRAVGPNGAQPRDNALFTPRAVDAGRGWPLRTPVAARVLLAEVARVAGVVSVAGVRLADGAGAETEAVDMAGLELPRILGLSVVAGDPIAVDTLRSGDAQAAATRRSFLPVPVTPANC